jgi:hypothetical protein
MNSIIGTWRLVAETAWDGAGQSKPTILGPLAIGLCTYTAAGRMMAVLSDGRRDPIDGPRAYASYCGTYTFDGSRVVTEVDGASEPSFREAAQIREVRFNGDRIAVRPPVGFRGADDVTREFTWERIA